MTQSIVFIATKRDAESLAQRLQGEGHAAAALHGDMNQHERTARWPTCAAAACARWSRPTSPRAASTSPGISHVINFDLPRQAGGLRPPDRPHRAAPARRASRSRSRTTPNAARCARSSASPARRFPRTTFPGSSRGRGRRRAGDARRPAFGKPAPRGRSVRRAVGVCARQASRRRVSRPRRRGRRFQPQERPQPLDARAVVAQRRPARRSAA